MNLLHQEAVNKLPPPAQEETLNDIGEVNEDQNDEQTSDHDDTFSRPPKKARTRYTQAFKVKAIRLMKSGVSIRQVSNQLDVPYTTCKAWNQTSESILSNVEKHHCLQAKAHYDSPLWRIEAALNEYYQRCMYAPRNLRPNVSVALLLQLAKNCKERLLAEHINRLQHNDTPFLTDRERTNIEQFSCSPAWAHKFIKLRGWRNLTRSRKEEPSPLEVFRAKLQRYPPERVFWVQHMPLAFQVLPRESYYTHTNTATSDMDNNNNQSFPLTYVVIYFGCNETGTLKLPLCMLHSTKPACFTVTRPVFSFMEEPSGHNHSAFQQYITRQMEGAIKERFAHEKCLLIVPHNVPILTGQASLLEVVSLPEMCRGPSSLVTLIKRKYRYKLLESVMTVFSERHALVDMVKQANMKADTAGLVLGHLPHAADCQRLLQQVWDEVSVAAIQKAWKHTNLRTDCQFASDADFESTEDTEVLWQQIAQFAQKNPILDAQTFDLSNKLEEAVYEAFRAFKDVNDIQAVGRALHKWTCLEDTVEWEQYERYKLHGRLQLDVLLGLQQKPTGDASEIVPEAVSLSNDAIRGHIQQLFSISSIFSAAGNEDFQDIAFELHENATRALRIILRKETEPEKEDMENSSSEASHGA